MSVTVDMEDISYARKYRPTTLGNYIGNEGLKETIKLYLAKGRPQTILTYGTTGCGKTTIARLIMKEYMCEDWNPEDGACGKCSSCLAIDEFIRTGTEDIFPDIHEVDMGDKSGKKDLDSVLEGIEYPAMSATGWKVYLFDEIQAAGVAAQTRLLKIVEEPPEKVLIMFSTTDPQKLLDTIKNRCQLKLKVTKPTTSELSKLLARVCAVEGKDYDLTGLRLICARNDYIIRDSLNSIEHVINTRGSAKGIDVAKEFNEVTDDIVFDFFKYYLEKDYVGYSGVIYKIKMKYDYNQFLMSLTSFVTRGIFIINGVDVEGLSKEEIQSYLKLFKTFSTHDISYLLSSLKKMNMGDIEANLMYFIYSENESSSESTGTVEVVEGSISDERVFRNSNVEKLESIKMSKGKESIKNEMETVGFSAVSDMFNLQKVE